MRRNIQNLGFKPTRAVTVVIALGLILIIAGFMYTYLNSLPNRQGELTAVIDRAN